MRRDSPMLYSLSLALATLLASDVNTFTVAFSALVPRSTVQRGSTRSTTRYLAAGSYYDEEDDDDDDDDDEDDLIDVDSLGDWRAFRRSLSTGAAEGENKEKSLPKILSVSEENEEVLESQNEDLAEEYRQGVWAHETSLPEVGGIVVRMPLEVELFRNHKRSLNGDKLRKKYDQITDNCSPSVYFNKAQQFVEEGMLQLISLEDVEDNSLTVDMSTLEDDAAEMLALYLDHQENWQEVCLVVEGENNGMATVVLNRPIAMKLTDNLAEVVLYGNDDEVDIETVTKQNDEDLLSIRFMLAFGQECAIYVGGPDQQDRPARMLHGISDLPGAKEIAPGVGIYEGGIGAAIDGVLRGKYRALDFRFILGQHDYPTSELEVAVLLGKYQPIACARSLVLKQCLSLPKPLWHEVLELCGGNLKEISELEMNKRDSVSFQIIDGDADDDDNDLADEIIDELDKLNIDWDEDDDDDETFFDFRK